MPSMPKRKLPLQDRGRRIWHKLLLQKTTLRRVCLLVSLTCSVSVTLCIYQDIDVRMLPAVWGLSATILFLPDLLFLDYSKYFQRITRLCFASTLKYLIILFLPVFIRLCFMLIPKFHGDEALTGYFSHTENLWGINFFMPIPSDPAEWVIRFPSLYFFLQKYLLKAFEPSILALRMTVLPYSFIVSICLYILLSDIFDNGLGILGVILYAFLAPSLYFETFALKNIVSNALYAIFITSGYFFYKRPSTILALLLGIIAGLGFLFYHSSYLISIYFIILLIIMIPVHKAKFSHILVYLAYFMYSFVVIIAPFFIYMFKSDHYYILHRFIQVGFIDSQASELGLVTGIYTRLQENLFNSILSLFTDGIGGSHGFLMSGKSFFDVYTLGLLIMGFVSLGVIFYKEKNSYILQFPIHFLSIFFFGNVLTDPPPSFARMTMIVIPVILLISFNFRLLFISRLKSMKILFSAILLFSFISMNILHFTRSVQTEIVHSDLSIIWRLNQAYPDRMLYIVAFPSYHLEKLAYFEYDADFELVSSAPSEEVLRDYDRIIIFHLHPNEEAEEYYAAIMPEADVLRYPQAVVYIH